MPIWDYNDKLYLKINDTKIKELPNEHTFQQYVPYIMDITFRKYDFEKNGEQITGYSICEINKKENIKLLCIEKWDYQHQL